MISGGGKPLIISELWRVEASERLKSKDIKKPLLCSFERDNGFLPLLRNLYADFVCVRVSLFFHNCVGKRRVKCSPLAFFQLTTDN